MAHWKKCFVALVPSRTKAPNISYWTRDLWLQNMLQVFFCHPLFWHAKMLKILMLGLWRIGIDGKILKWVKNCHWSVIQKLLWLLTLLKSLNLTKSNVKADSRHLLGTSASISAQTVEFDPDWAVFTSHLWHCTFDTVNCCLHPVWPDWVIYWTMGNFSIPLATIILPKSATFLSNFCKIVKIINFSSEII